METILAIDPGTTRSGWSLLSNGVVIASGKTANDTMLVMVMTSVADTLAIEMVEGRGMQVGKETFETCVWIGRFMQAWRYPDNVQLVYRRTVKKFLCGNITANDSNVRRAILDCFPGTGGGATPQIGTKSQPGPLYGVTADAWAALGVALTVIGGNHGPGAFN